MCVCPVAFGFDVDFDFNLPDGFKSFAFGDLSM